MRHGIYDSDYERFTKGNAARIAQKVKTDMAMAASCRKLQDGNEVQA